MINPLEKTITEIDELFNGIENCELAPKMLNDVLKRAHPEEQFATFKINESKSLGLGDIVSHRIRYELLTDNESKGKFECLFNASYFSDDSEDYILEIEENRKF